MQYRNGMSFDREMKTEQSNVVVDQKTQKKMVNDSQDQLIRPGLRRQSHKKKFQSAGKTHQKEEKFQNFSGLKLNLDSFLKKKNIVKCEEKCKSKGNSSRDAGLRVLSKIVQGNELQQKSSAFSILKEMNDMLDYRERALRLKKLKKCFTLLRL